MRAFVLIIVLLVVSPAFGQQPKEITNSIGMELVLIPEGTFTMGSPEGEVRRFAHETQHEVKISRSYYLGMYEVTQGEYEEVMGENPSFFNGARNLVATVSWDDAIAFCKKLSEMPKEKAARRVYRLPTEAEWEYACRAGSTTAYSFGDTVESLEEYAWFGEGGRGKTHPVGLKKANQWRLYDMHGNVFEWCKDWFAVYPSGAATDPLGPIEGSNRVLRGGCCSLDAGVCRSAVRFGSDPSSRNSIIGFRVALSLPAKQPDAASSK